jgi:uncharacterized protein (TIGR03067 family)
MQRLINTGVLAGGMLALAALVHAQDKKSESAGAAAEIMGSYQITAGQVGSRKIPSDQLTDNQVNITDKVITVYDKDRKELYAATYELDTKKKPWALHMTSSIAVQKGVKTEGLITREGENVKLIYALPEGKAPDDFEPEEKQQLFILRKRAN